MTTQPATTQSMATKPLGIEVINSPPASSIKPLFVGDPEINHQHALTPSSATSSSSSTTSKAIEQALSSSAKTIVFEKAQTIPPPPIPAAPLTASSSLVISSDSSSAAPSTSSSSHFSHVRGLHLHHHTTAPATNEDVELIKELCEQSFPSSKFGDEKLFAFIKGTKPHARMMMLKFPSSASSSFTSSSFTSSSPASSSSTKESLLCITANHQHKSSRLYIISVRNGRLSHPHSKHKLEKVKKIEFASPYFISTTNTTTATTTATANQTQTMETTTTTTAATEEAGLEFVLHFWQQRKIRFSPDTLENRNKFIAKLLGIFRTFYGFLPETENFDALSLLSQYLDSKTPKSICASCPTSSSNSDFGQAVPTPTTTSSSSSVSEKHLSGSSTSSSASQSLLFKELKHTLHAASAPALVHSSSSSSSNNELQKYFYEAGFSNGLFSDVTVKFLSKERKLHRLILNRSPVLRSMMMESPPSASSTTIVLDSLLSDSSSDPSLMQDAVEFVLRFFYTGSCDLPKSTTPTTTDETYKSRFIAAILFVASKLQISDLLAQANPSVFSASTSSSQRPSTAAASGTAAISRPGAEDDESSSSEDSQPGSEGSTCFDEEEEDDHMIWAQANDFLAATPNNHHHNNGASHAGAGNNGHGGLLTSRHSNGSLEGDATAAAANHSSSSSIEKSSSSKHISKNHAFRSMFNLNVDESVVESFSCAYYKRMIHHGKLYISQHFVCFFSNLLLVKTSLIINFKDIISITKKNTAIVVPNAIEITTRDSSFFFASFIDRNWTFTLLNELWRNNNGTSSSVATAAAAAAAASSSAIDRKTKMLRHSTSCVLSQKFNKKLAAAVKEDELEISTTDNNASLSVPSSNEVSETTTTTTTTTSILKRKKNAISIDVATPVDSQQQQQPTTTTSASSATTSASITPSSAEVQMIESSRPASATSSSSLQIQEMDGIAPSPISAGASNLDESIESAQSNQPQQQVKIEEEHQQQQQQYEEPHEEEEIAEEHSSRDHSMMPTPMMTPDFPHDVSNHIDSIENLPPSENFKNESEIKMVECINVELRDVDVTEVFLCLFADGSHFTRDYHSARSEFDVSVSSWEKASDSNSSSSSSSLSTTTTPVGRARTVSYMTTVQIPMMATRLALMHEKQRYIFSAKHGNSGMRRRRLLVQVVAFSNDVPYGDCFRVHTKIDVENEFDEPEQEPHHKIHHTHHHHHTQQPVGPKKCRFVIHSGLEWVKGTIFKKRIEDRALKSINEAMALWNQIMHSMIEEFKKTRAVAAAHSAAAVASAALKKKKAAAAAAAATAAASAAATTTTVSTPAVLTTTTTNNQVVTTKKTEISKDVQQQQISEQQQQQPILIQQQVVKKEVFTEEKAQPQPQQLLQQPPKVIPSQSSFSLKSSTSSASSFSLPSFSPEFVRVLLVLQFSFFMVLLGALIAKFLF